MCDKRAAEHSELSNETGVRPEPALRCTTQAVDVIEVTGRMEKHVLVNVDGSGESRLLRLQDDWVDTPITRGDPLSAIGSPWILSNFQSLDLPTMTISMRSNFLVLHPDVLLPATTVSSAFPCQRKAILTSLVRCDLTGDPSAAQSRLLGNLIHGAVQQSLAENRPPSDTTPWLPHIDRAIREAEGSLEAANGCFRGNLDVAQTIAELNARAAPLATLDRPVVDSQLNLGCHSNSVPPSGGRHIALNRTRDIEEAISSPTYGLKGKVDASMEVLITDSFPSVGLTSCGPDSSRGCIMPLEIKTGLTMNALPDRAQTLLYALLLSDRYGIAIPGGLLFYTETGGLIHVQGTRNEFRGLIITRNDLAASLVIRSSSAASSLTFQGDETDSLNFRAFCSSLPEPIDDPWTCERCIALDACSLYRKAIEATEPIAEDIQKLYDVRTSHLNVLHTTFFLTWERLICLEDAAEQATRNQPWTVTATTREERGSCFAHVTLLSTEDSLQPDALDIKRRYRARFARATTEGTTPFTSHMQVGDRVIVSIEPNVIAFAKGTITALFPSAVEVSVDRRLDALHLRKHLSVPHGHEFTFQIDKDQSTGHTRRLRTNLARLMRPTPASRRWLLLLVDLVAPSFFDVGRIGILDVPGNINAGQSEALRMAFAAKDYALIQGLPGTGKSTIIAKLITMLVQRGKTVLLTSYTHAAVDNILSKLGDVPFEVLRVGDIEKIHPAARKYSLEGVADPSRLFEQRRLLPPVVAATALSLDHAIFARRRFNYCIVDEASQVSLPACLGPLLLSTTAILVGDHRQLPPLVRNEQARASGLSVSLFERLLRAHPQAVAQLNCQYRMNDDIMYLSNRLVYDGELISADNGVLNREVYLPLLPGLQCNFPSWLGDLLRPSRKVAFVNTDGIRSQESHVGSSIQNALEADLISQTADALLRCGLPAIDLAVISLYHGQTTLISSLLANKPHIDVSTADRSQGQEKECVIVSTVRSNRAGTLGDLPRDWRRVNVALTRARSKLIVFGSRSTLRSASVFSNLFNIMDDRSWVCNIPSPSTQTREVRSTTL